jgi:photosystem II stability/assembly factor-like uncharacterized protein
VWHLEGGRFATVVLPLDPTQILAFYKVWGSSSDSVWVVGTGGVVLRFDGALFSPVATNRVDPLFTVYAAARDRVAIVGGADLGVLLESDDGDSFRQVSLPDGTHQLYGVCLTDNGGYAVGQNAVVLARDKMSWATVETGIEAVGVLHSVWVDPTGGMWAVGGNVANPPLGDGIMVHHGNPVPTSYADGG